MKALSYARGAYLLGIALLVVLFIPSTWAPLVVGKVAMASILFLIAALLYLFAAWRNHTDPIPFPVLLFSLTPLAYLLSFAFSMDRAVGVAGASIEPDTLLLMSLAFAVAMLGAMLFRTPGTAWVFVRTLFFTFLAGTLFQCVVLIFGLPGFSDRSTNLVGKWDDLGVVILMLAFLMLTEFQGAHLSTRARRLGAVLLVVLMALLAIVNFTLAWALLLAGATVLAVFSWLSSRTVSWPSIVCGVVAAVFLLFGAAINAQYAKYIPVAALEIRPSIQATMTVASAAHGSSVKNAAFGTGPNTFGDSWLMHKPAEVNNSAFWNLDFAVGYSTIATAFSTTGMVGALALLLPMIMVCIGLWRARRAQEGILVPVSLGGAALIWWMVLLFYVPSPNMVLVAFATAGVATGILWRNSWELRAKSVWWAFSVLLVVLFAWTSFYSVRRLATEWHVTQAAVALQAGNADVAMAQSAKALSIENTPQTLRLATDAGALKLTQLATAGDPNTQDAFSKILQGTLDVGQRAVAADNTDYRSYVSLGNIYAFLASNKVDGAYQNAKTAYQIAQTLAPKNPSIPLFMAKLEASAGTLQGVQDALKEALTLKPDYTDAILFLAQVDIANNDLASAIRDTQAAVQSAPGVPAIWLELGLLYYAGGDSKNAIEPLEKAIELQPDYANAQYFLGLSYAAQGRTQDAYALFKKVEANNPDNEDIKAVIANMDAGRPPLESATSTATTTSN